MRRRVRSKLMSMALTLTMAAGLLSGCGGNSVSETDKTTITIWHDKEDAVAEVLQKKLEELEPDVHVVLEKKSDLTESLKMVGSDPKAAPDMYFFAHDKIGVYAEMDILAPITDIIPKEELDVYMDNTLEAATYKGEIYQLPVYYETLLFMYNRLYMKDRAYLKDNYTIANKIRKEELLLSIALSEYKQVIFDILTPTVESAKTVLPSVQKDKK